MGTITASNITTRAGSGSIKISESTLPTTNATTESISSIKAEFDEEDESENASKVYLKLGEFKFTLFDGLDNGDSLFNELNGVSATSRIDVEFSFTTDNSRSWTENFYFYPKDVNYNRDKRTVSIESHQDAVFNDTVDDIFTNNSGDLETYNYLYGASASVDCMPVSAFILNAINLFNTSNSNFNNSFVFADKGQTDGERSYVVTSSTTQAKEILFDLAAAEGSVIGSFMGYNFYLNRLSTANAVTITEDDIEEETLNINIGLNSYRTIRNIFKIGSANYHSFFDLTGSTDNLNDQATKRLDAYFISDPIEEAFWDSADSDYDSDSTQPDSVIVSEADVSGEAKAGETTITVTTGAGTAISAGDALSFGDTEPGLFYIADSAISGGELTIRTPLIDEIADGTTIYIIKDTGINEIAEQGVKSYAACYDARGDSIIEFTILDIDKVRPDQSISFDSSLPAALSGTTYRPSELEYDIENDKINVKAYQI